MTRHRQLPGRGFVIAALLPKGPTGRPLCRYCEQEVARPRRTFCSDLCVHEWKVRSNPGYARRCVWKRDRGQCALCPTVCQLVRVRPQRGTGVEFNSGALGWEMDHTIPVIDGGGSCGLENLRTLCIPCHRRVTAELAGRRAMERRRSIDSSSGATRDIRASSKTLA